MGGAAFQVLLAPALVPFRLRERFMRHVAVCHEAPLTGMGAGPGILILETSFPDCVTEYEGWRLPESAKKAVSLSSQKMFNVMPTADGKAINLQVAVRLAFPVSPWIVPLNLVKRVVANLLRESLQRIK